MAVIYAPYQSPLADKSGKKLFYPRIVRLANVSTAQIAREIAQYASLSPGDVRNTIDNLVTVMTTHLQSSEGVTLEGLGTFRMVMTARGKGVETAKEVSASQASLTVRFQPSSTRKADGTLATRSMVSGVKCVRIDKADEELPEGGGGGTGGDNTGGVDPTEQ